MSLDTWEQKVLEAPGAPERVTDIEEKLRLVAGLTALREQAGYSQRELAVRIGVTQPRIAAIEKARNVTLDVLEKYVEALGGRLEMTVVKGRRRVSLLGGPGASTAKTVRPALAQRESGHAEAPASKGNRAAKKSA